jgi:hypothetical protein
MSLSNQPCDGSRFDIFITDETDLTVENCLVPNLDCMVDGLMFPDQTFAAGCEFGVLCMARYSCGGKLHHR